MILAAYLSFLVVVSSVGAAKSGGDDEWVHLPNKCEGNWTLAAFGSQNGVRGPPEGPQQRQEWISVSVVSLCGGSHRGEARGGRITTDTLIIHVNIL